jgi:hypothetical protein
MGRLTIPTPTPTTMQDDSASDKEAVSSDIDADEHMSTNPNHLPEHLFTSAAASKTKKPLPAHKKRKRTGRGAKDLVACAERCGRTQKPWSRLPGMFFPLPVPDNPSFFPTSYILSHIPPTAPRRLFLLFFLAL